MSIFDFFKKAENTQTPTGTVAFLVVGLGNPGKEYLYTRHNTGFLTLDYIAERLSVTVNRAKFNALTADAVIGGNRVLLIKPQTYMNESGVAVRQAADFYKIPTEHILFKIFQMLRTFFLCVVGRLIFLGNGLSDSFHMISSMFKRTQTVYTVESFPLTVNEWCVVLICVIFLSGVSVVQEIMEKKQAEMTIRDWLDKQNVLLQMGVVLTGILVILCFGVYGQGAGAAFIYEQF